MGQRSPVVASRGVKIARNVEPCQCEGFCNFGGAVTRENYGFGEGPAGSKTMVTSSV